MSISQLNGPEGPPDSAVQNRLTAAGLVLATLFFSGSFALQSHSQAKTGKAFPETFAYLEVTLTVGTLMAIVSITCLLVCQQCIATDHAWYKSKRAWFTVATVAQYLSISQAMSAGLTELVFGLKHAFQAVYLANMLAFAATLVWIVLLLIAPIHTLRSWWPHLYKGERVMVGLGYALLLVFVLSSNGLIYLLQDGAPATFGSVLKAICQQLIQPMMWGNPWAHPVTI